MRSWPGILFVGSMLKNGLGTVGLIAFPFAVADARVHLVQVVGVGLTSADVHEERDIGKNPARQLPLDADVDIGR